MTRGHICIAMRVARCGPKARLRFWSCSDWRRGFATILGQALFVPLRICPGSNIRERWQRNQFLPIESPILGAARSAAEVRPHSGCARLCEEESGKGFVGGSSGRGGAAQPAPVQPRVSRRNRTVTAKAMENLRVEAVRLMIEEARHPVGVIARETGFSDPERMRRAFLRTFAPGDQARCADGCGRVIRCSAYGSSSVSQ